MVTILSFINNQGQSITPKEAHERLKTEKGIILLDVRSAEEYKEKHIPGSINIPLNLMAQVESKLPDKESTMFVYCLSGARSANACKLLTKFGYNHVYNMGGINNWPFETENNTKA